MANFKDDLKFYNKAQIESLEEKQLPARSWWRVLLREASSAKHQQTEEAGQGDHSYQVLQVVGRLYFALYSGLLHRLQLVPTPIFIVSFV